MAKLEALFILWQKEFAMMNNLLIASIDLLNIAVQSVTNQRLKELTKDHPADLTKILHGLVQKSLLLSEGAGQSTFYYLPGEYPIKTELGMKNSVNGVSSGANGVGYSVELMHIAKVVSKTQRALKNIVENTIYELCGKQELSAVEIAELLGRKEKNIRLNGVCDGYVLKLN